MEHDDTQLLQDMFCHLGGRQDLHSKDILDNLKSNSFVLQKACREENYDFIKTLVKNGCRLRTTQKKKDLDQDNWSRYCRSLPSKQEDEVKDLRILKLMAKKSYIFSCYEAVIESKMDHNGQINDCECQSTISMMDSCDGVPLKTETRVSFERQHSCASNVYFEPDLFCADHVECNDPIFRYISIRL